MKKRLIPLLLMTALLGFVAKAAPVTPSAASMIAKAYLAMNEPAAQGPLALYETRCNSQGQAILYIFNIDTTGFIIVSADDDVPPVVGCSLNGAYSRERIADNFNHWLDDCVTDIDAVLSSSTLNAEMQAERLTWQAEWSALRRSDRSFYARHDGKNVNTLVETRWEQGAGYNNYCPEYSNGSNGHTVTGCVATAMAQIIRYHGYPNTGFYRHSYGAPSYGLQSVDFDSAYYDFSKMPVRVNRNSPTAQQHAVSLLCYHCGVAVDMTYEYSGHTSGSGAHSEDVPNGLKYFGYTTSYFMYKSTRTNSEWDSMLHHDLDLALPVYYSGSGNEGGHAFICDGYRNNNQYHFNFGWGGYSDGYYSLTSVNGFASAQAAVFNIVPSRIAPMHDTVYVDIDGTGDGTSWANATPNLHSVLTLCGLYKRGNIWVKSGTYYGDTVATHAFVIPNGVALYGGFEGTEQSIDERNPEAAPSIMSGQNRRYVAKTPSLNSTANVRNMTFADGFGENGSAMTLVSGLSLMYCIFENNSASTPEGAAVYIRDGNLYNCIMRNNHCGGIDINGGNLKNSLIHNNTYYGVKMDGGNIVNCDILSNTGVGVINPSGTIRNTVIWNNDSSLSVNDINGIRFCAVEGFGELDSNSNFGISNENRPLSEAGPFFMNPDTNRGPSSFVPDWHLSSLSPLLDAADTLRNGIYNTDLDGGSRVRNGRVDIGCYERAPGNAIAVADGVSTRLYPNPATNVLTVEGIEGPVAIYDMTGRQVLTSTCHAAGTLIDISHLPQGVYVLRHSDGSAKLVKR